MKAHKEYYEANRDKLLAHKRAYRLEHKEEMQVRERAYYEKHKNKRRAQKRTLRKQNLEFLITEGLLTDCIICGFPKEKYVAIDWHHIDPTQKEAIMGRLTRNANREILLQEAKKCVCMCRNCHSLYHDNNTEVVEKYNQYMENRENERI